MEVKLYQVDAFTDQVFGGNPAAVCPLGGWPEDSLLQKIAEENNLSETAFFIAEVGVFHLRWFTPQAEVDLCGHATLATAHVLFKHLKYEKPEIVFRTRSGELRVEQSEHGLSMNFPASNPELVAKVPSALLAGLGLQEAKVFSAYDYIVELDSEAQVAGMKPDFAALAELDGRGVIVTAPGNEHDFVSRCFFPKLRVNEDPVTGSAHCELAPYWAEKLGKNKLVGAQLSKRGGIVHCEVITDEKANTRVILTGQAADYMQGMISIS